jgi:PTS system N-acetylglucosamine-specific IIC component
MAGFFPVMMFGLPAACLAMFHEAKPDRRAEAGGLLLSLALTALLTGVTEPIEFSFMFLAPVLYVVHAVLTGAAMVIMNLIGVKLGFGFSAGLFDYVLNYGKATRPLLLLPVGLVYFGLYYGLFRLFIRRFDLKTHGREDAAPQPAAIVSGGPLDRPRAFVEALGGPANLVTVGACTTRLRLVVNNQDVVDEARLRSLGARGLVRPSARDLQVVVGATADQLAREIGEVLAAGPVVEVSAPVVGAQALAAALGGANNVTKVETRATRLVVSLANSALVDEPAALAAGARAIAGVSAGHVHVVIGPDAERAGADLTALALG